MGLVEGGTGSCIETCVECDVDGTEEVSIKVEEAMDIKNEIPEAIRSSSPINTEQEVRLWGGCVCVRWWQPMLLGHLLPQKETEITLIYFLLCVILWVPCSF